MTPWITGVVAARDRGHEELPEAGNVEDRFGDSGSGDETAERQADDREDREARVLERVAEEEATLGDAAGAGCVDVVGAQHVEYRGARRPGDEGCGDRAERDAQA